jgi:HNH endonuclease
MKTKLRPKVPRKLPACDHRLTPAERLSHYAKVDPLSGCHIWHGSISHAGYGKLNIRNRSFAAHRLAWTLKYGPIPPGMILCHRCDVRRCVNPDHLVLGTRADNMADHKAKRLAVHAARAATGPDSARIFVLYRGVALSGDVEAQPFGANLTEICAGRRTR